jgi:adenylate cyclase
MEDAESLWRLCSKKLSKTRYRIMHAGNLWEIDVFHEKNEGLVLAEIELSAPNQAFEPPFWLGEEVTDDARYLNVNLAQ